IRRCLRCSFVDRESGIEIPIVGWHRYSLPHEADHRNLFARGPSPFGRGCREAAGEGGRIEANTTLIPRFARPSPRGRRTRLPPGCLILFIGLLGIPIAAALTDIIPGARGMRFLRLSAAVSAFALLFCNSNFVHAGIDQSISGRLIFDGGDFQCEQRCYVTLLASGVRPIQTVFADLAGRFVFNNVARGFYTIRVEIEGLAPVTQSVEGRDGSEVNIIVPLTRNPKVQSKSSGTVDVSEFLDRYPKKAVSYFEKGSQLLKKNMNEEAVKYFRSALELAPTFYE